MSYLKNPFGLRNGEIVMIEDVPLTERGIKCRCVCPACGEPFEARLGNIRTHHFAHSGEGCSETVAYLTGAYSLIKEYALAQEIPLPALKIFWGHSEQKITESNFFTHIRFSRASYEDRECTVVQPVTVQFDSAEIVSSGNVPVALLLSHNSARVALSIVPPSTVCKDYYAKQYEDYATLKLNVSDVPFGELNKKDAFARLERELSNLRWLYSPKAIMALNVVTAENDRWIEAMAEARKLREEREREQREQRDKMREMAHHLTLVSDVEDGEERRQKQELDELKRTIERRSAYEEVKDLFTQQDKPISDSSGQRWIKCEICGEIKPTYEFFEYGGKNRVNSGICSSCNRSNR